VPSVSDVIGYRAEEVARIALIDALPAYDMTQRCKRERCKSKNGRGPRMVGTQAQVYCAACADRVMVYNPTKEELGLKRGAVRLRPDLPPGAKDRIFAIDFYRCQLCGRTAADHGALLEIGHMISVADWKTSDLDMAKVNGDDNLVTECKECNGAWGGKSLPAELCWRVIRARMSRNGLPTLGR
jgi:5-methylcytosine-specific restriction endonuclease McrA